MRFAKGNDQTKDYTAIIFNDQITLRNIPPTANEYKLNGRSIIEQFVNFYRGEKDKTSGIVNDPNDFLKQKSPDYFLKTLLRIIAVSLKTHALIKQLSRINFNDGSNLEQIVT